MKPEMARIAFVFGRIGCGLRVAGSIIETSAFNSERTLAASSRARLSACSTASSGVGANPPILNNELFLGFSIRRFRSCLNDSRGKSPSLIGAPFGDAGRMLSMTLAE
jgi:hypothetical protein